jgi:hypothetical protein
MTVVSSLGGTATKSLTYKDVPEEPQDTITITKADYKVGDKELIVHATSSAQPDATLTVEGYGKMTWKADKNRYDLKIRPIADPGTQITVNSNLGSSESKTVTLKY